jgi:hypothetical protein
MFNFSCTKQFFLTFAKIANKFIIFALYASVFTSISCSGKNNKSQTTEQVPSWYLNPSKNNDMYLYGVGEAASLSSSKKAALNDAASRLRTDVSSTTKTNMSAENDLVSNSLRQNITTSVEKTTFNNFEVSQTATVGDKIYTEVKIDRAKMIEEKLAEIDAIEAKITSIRQNGNSFNNILEKRAEYKKVFALLPQLRSTSYLLNSLQGMGFVGFSLKQKLDIANSFENEYNNLISKIIFKIEPCKAQDSIKQLLNKAGLKVNNSVVDSSNVVNVKCSVFESYNQIYSTHTTKVELILGFESMGKTISSKTVVFSGNSSIGKTESEKNAYQNLSDGKINENAKTAKTSSPFGELDDDIKNVEKVLGF